MTADAERRIHQRLDELGGVIAEIAADTKVLAAGCKDCRPVVMGNSKRQSVDVRLTSLELVSRWRTKGFWVAVGCVSAIVATVASAVVVNLFG